MFFKLTLTAGDTVFVNVNKIEYITASAKKDGTSIVYIDQLNGNWFHVQESMEEIEAMMEVEPVIND